MRREIARYFFTDFLEHKINAVDGKVLYSGLHFA
jgi:hypothetical protein